MSKIFTITDGLENLGALRTGGQGSVYKGRRGDVISAVKILPTPIHSENEDDKNYKDFQNEVSKLKKVNEEPNPHVVKILSSGITESGSLPFIEMEFIEGPDLEDLIQEPNHKIFTVKESVRVAEQLSNALAHCHKVHVKHGDIKSNNVKLNLKSDKYMLLDFGLSIMSDEQRRTSLRQAGAIEFMAPEQNDGEMLLESDVYSFGIILFELLAGSVPFPLDNKSETSRNAVMISHMEKPVPDILEIRKSNLPSVWEESMKGSEMLVPSWLLAVVAKCLEKLPKNRFKNGLELHEAIVDSISSKNIFAYLPAALVLEPDPPVPAAALTRVKPWYSLFSEHRKPVIAGAVLLLLFLAMFAGYSSLNNPDTDLVDTAALRAENQRLSDSIANAERLNDKRIQDSINSLPVNTPPSRWSNGKGNSKGKGKGRKRK